MEEMSLFNYVVTVLQFTVMYVAFEFMLDRRCKLWIVALAEFTALNAEYFVLLLVFPARLTFARVPLGMVILALPLLLYKNKWYLKLLAFAVAQSVLVLSELLMVIIDKYNILVFTTGIEGLPLAARMAQYAVYISIYTVLMFIMCALVVRHSKRGFGRLSVFEIIISALFFLCQCVLLLGWATISAYATTLAERSVITLVALLFLVSDVSVFILMFRVANRWVLLAENESIRRQMSAQSNYYDMFISQSDAIRRMRHDIANHLFTINAMLSKGEADEARNYSRELQSDGICKPTLGLCLNATADAFLPARFARLEAEGIEVKASIVLPTELGISPVDLVSAFGNLLDNAEEALRGAEEKYVVLKARIQGAYLVIDTENPCAHVRDTRSAERRIPELERGVGFCIMNNMAQKYDGQFKYGIENDVFRASLVLKTENRNA